ncbi:hypothetical protein GCM10027277_57710 [Pseudoduganella ginsengisoli]|uniref:Conjugal transfer protein TraM n=1 Tax=Pseudoduganella ginsengisoli TaxID=1462440 RepID=A0A6L6Q8D7_9BURK|nr:conjugal transfer protein TraM [Pseudoduganella ginsengisoli]MTW05865.1 conjugal transfer protein TraM [Pseudoduganella ginsengisoli]
MADTDALIKEIAVKHGIALGKDDPILILQTINAKLLEDGLEAQKAAMSSLKEDLEEIAQRWGHDAKDKAERILTAGLSANKNAMQEAMNQGAKRAGEAVKAEIEAGITRLEMASQVSTRTATINMAASLIALAAAGLVAILVLFR